MDAARSDSKIEAIYPLTFMQQASLFHSLEDRVDSGLLQLDCFIQGKIDLDRFKRAWTKNARCHQALRSSVHWENLEKPVQVVHKEAVAPVVFSDLSGFDEPEQARLFEDQKKSESRKGLDLFESPTWRIVLFKIDNSKYRLLWTCHHILIDGWSGLIVLRDFLSFYQDQGTSDNLGRGEFSANTFYLDWVKRQDSLAAARFWNKLIDGLEAPRLMAGGGDKFNIPETDSTARWELALSNEDSEILKDRAKRYRVTTSTLVQGLWAILLSRLFETANIAFGLTVTGRSGMPRMADQMVGMFTNLLPVIIDVEPRAELAQWLESFQKLQLKIRAYEFVNPAELPRLTDRSGIGTMFDNLVVFQNNPVTALSEGDITLSKIKTGMSTAYPLTLEVLAGEEIRFQLKYKSHLISDEVADWIKVNLSRLIDLFKTGECVTIDHLLNGLGDSYGLLPVESDEQSPGTANTVYAPPGTKTELEMTRSWEQLLDRNPVGVDDNFFELGGTSFIAISLFAKIEKQFGRRLQPISILKHGTIRKLSKLITGETIEDPWSSLVTMRARGSKPPIFCLHSGGGHVFFYKNLAKYLGDDQPVYALQRLDLDDNTATTQSIEEMASHYLSEIRGVQEKGPYALLGYCFSAAVGWEITRQLCEQGETVSLLAMIDSPPFYIDKRSNTEKVGGILNKIKRFDLSFVKTIWKGRIMHPLKQNWLYFTGDLEYKNQQILLKNLTNTTSGYVWKALPVNVTLIRTKPMTKIPEQNSAIEEWNELALNGVDTFIIDGNHLTLYEEPDVKVLSRQIKECLNNAFSESDVANTTG